MLELQQKWQLSLDLYKAEKLAAVLATSTLITPNSKILKKLPCIQYLVKFHSKFVNALGKLSSQVNIMSVTLSSNKMSYPSQLILAHKKVPEHIYRHKV